MLSVFRAAEARGPSGPSYWSKGAKFEKLMNILILARVIQGGQEGQVVFEGRAAKAPVFGI